MTISKVLNSCCDYSPIENPIKNAIHTWYLPSGGETHLIRHDDKIEFLTIKGKERTSVFPNLEGISEAFSSPEEFIELMIEMDPTFDANGKLQFINAEKIHTWERKYENPVELVSAVDELYLKTISDKTTVLRKFLAPDGLDMGHWCVTMLNSDTSNFLNYCLPCNWMGHAMLIVETIEKGNYFARQVDLIKIEGKATVRLFEIPQYFAEDYGKIYAKSETYRRPKEDIQRITDQSYKDICNQKEGKPSVIFALDSGKIVEGLSGLSLAISRGHTESFPLTSLVQQRVRMNRTALSHEQQVDFYNCIQYAVNKLSLAKIEDLLESRYVLSKTFWPTPVLYAGSKLKAMAQEASFIAAYSALLSTTPSFLGFLIAGPIGGFIRLGSRLCCRSKRYFIRV